MSKRLFIGGVFMLALFCAAAYAYTRVGVKEAKVPVAVPPALAESVPATVALGEDTRLYKSAAFHYSLAYPQGLEVREYMERGGALTTTFSNPHSGESFQVFVTPYSGADITPERFLLDEPSGVRDQPTDVVIAGTRATMFFSRNSIMGDTREVWFIRGGYLYEVTTYKELDAWLAAIMQSWQFI